MDNDEEWRDIPGFGGGYQASNLGRIRSTGKPYPQLLNNGETRLLRRKPKIMALGKKPSGHLNVYVDGKSRNAHSLICSAFKGPRPDGLVCAHLNGSPADNRPENLVWVTMSENLRHCYEHGTAGKKLDRAKVADIRRRRSLGETGPSIAARYDLHADSVYKIANRRLWHVD